MFKDKLKDKIDANTLILGGIITITVALIVGVFFYIPNVTPEVQKEVLTSVKTKHYYKGPDQASITLVEFSDFQCPACAGARPSLEEISAKYKDSVKFVYRHLPLSIHKNSKIAAQAAEAAGSQGKFWEYHDKLFDQQLTWSELKNSEVIVKFSEYAKEVGVADLEKFKTELSNGKYLSIIESDLADAATLKLRGTPSIFLNGEKVSNYSVENLSKQIDKILNGAK